MEEMPGFFGIWGSSLCERHSPYLSPFLLPAMTPHTVVGYSCRFLRESEGMKKEFRPFPLHRSWIAAARWMAKGRGDNSWEGSCEVVVWLKQVKKPFEVKSRALFDVERIGCLLARVGCFERRSFWKVQLQAQINKGEASNPDCIKFIPVQFIKNIESESDWNEAEPISHHPTKPCSKILWFDFSDGFLVKKSSTQGPLLCSFQCQKDYHVLSFDKGTSWGTRREYPRGERVGEGWVVGGRMQRSR